MNITKIDASAQLISRWSGGTTTQLAIEPCTAVYADRDFLWRVSSAVVELPESDFTPLPDYDRILMILEGELTLCHDGGEEYTLRPLEQTFFDGASKTFSRGQVTDFNLMMRKGRCTGQVTAKTLAAGEKYTQWLSDGFDSYLVYCIGGEAMLITGEETICIARGEAVLLGGVANADCILQGEGTVILAQMQEK